MADDVESDVLRRLLARLPESERCHAVREIANGLGEDARSYSAARSLAILLDDFPDEIASGTLYNFLLSSIRQGAAKSVANSCINSVQIRDSLLATISTLLYRHLSGRLGGQDGDGSVVSRPDISRLCEDSRLRRCDQIVGDSVPPSDAVNYLSFLMHLFRRSSTVPSISVGRSVLDYVFSFLFARESSLHTAALGAAFALLRAMQDGHVTVDLEKARKSFSWQLWDCIELLIVNGRYSAYQLWLRWLSLPSQTASLRYAINGMQYWTLIQQALVHGDFEQRKASLHILRTTLDIAVDQELDVECGHLMLHGTKAEKGKWNVSHIPS